MTKDNLFIAFEGIDGSGKSSQVALLKNHLEDAGHKVYTTFEPTDSPIGKLIRDIFNHRMEGDDKTIAGLFVADRLNHIQNQTNGILKMLNDGYTVITDRYYFSSYAYHSVHMSMDWVIKANELSAELLRPDLNIYIDISPEESMKRLKKGRDSMEMYETLDNLSKVHKTYEIAFDKLKVEECIFKVDGNRHQAEIADEIWERVKQL
jgi:dTMP kinase